MCIGENDVEKYIPFFAFLFFSFFSFSFSFSSSREAAEAGRQATREGLMGAAWAYITFPSADTIIDTTITNESMLVINND